MTPFFPTHLLGAIYFTKRVGRKEREIRAYKISANVDLELFHEYKCKLQKTINRLFKQIFWEESCDHPILPIAIRDVPSERELEFSHDAKGLREFIREQRNEEAREFRQWLRSQRTRFHAHYVDCIIKDCKMILLSWYENYIGGRRTRRCPWIRSTWVRVKSTQYRVDGNKIRVTIIPKKKYFEFEIPENSWFMPRVHEWSLGELILKPDEIILTFNKPKEKFKPEAYISIDVNKDTIDILIITRTKTLWIRIDWKELVQLNQVYQHLRSNVQNKLNHNKPKMKKLLRKYSRKRYNRINDRLHKLSKFIAELAKVLKALVIVEDLEKEAMYNGSQRHNQEIWMRPWRTLVQYLSYKAHVKQVDPRFTTKRCNYCGSLNTIVANGTVYCHRCKRSIDRQLNATINIYTKYRALEKLKRMKTKKIRVLQTEIRRKMPEVPTRPVVLTIDQMHSSQVVREILKLL